MRRGRSQILRFCCRTAVMQMRFQLRISHAYKYICSSDIHICEDCVCVCVHWVMINDIYLCVCVYVRVCARSPKSTSVRRSERR